MYILHNKGNKVRRSDPYHNAYITSFSDWKLTSTTKKVASNRCTAPNKHKKIKKLKKKKVKKNYNKTITKNGRLHFI